MTYYFEVYSSKSNEYTLNKAYVTEKTGSLDLTKSMNLFIWALPLISRKCFHGHLLWWPYFHDVMVSVFTILLICSQLLPIMNRKFYSHTLYNVSILSFCSMTQPHSILICSTLMKKIYPLPNIYMIIGLLSWISGFLYITLNFTY